MRIKRCPTCGLAKFVTEFSKNKCTKDGLHGQCKTCNKQYRIEHKTEIAAHCRQYNQEHKTEIAACCKQYHQKHETELTAYNKQYCQSHKAEIAAYGKRYKQDHKVEMSAYYKRYRIDHKTEIAAYLKRYRQTEAGKNANRKSLHKRRALKINTTIKDFNPNEVFKRDNYRCQLCGKKTRPDYKNRYHPLYPNLDHIVPLSLGGAHTKENTQCLCRQCNTQKHSNGKGDQLRMFG